MAFSVVWELIPLKSGEERIRSLPLSGLGFEGQEITPPKEVQEVFKDVTYVQRAYKVRDRVYIVSILDGTHNRHAVHDPTFCAYGGGWAVSGRERLPVEGGQVEKVTMVKGDQKRELLLWFSNRAHKFPSIYEYWYVASIRRLSMGYSGEEPIRIMVQPVDNDTPNWREFIRNFPPLWEI